MSKIQLIAVQSNIGRGDKGYRRYPMDWAIMAKELFKPQPDNASYPFERIRRVNDAGNEHWSSRDFARVPWYTDYRNFEQVIAKARIAYFNSGQRVDDHFVEINEMVETDIV